LQDTVYWYLANGKFILDSFYFLVEPDSETPIEWNDAIEKRINNVYKLGRKTYQEEVDALASIVTRGSFLTRSYQSLLVHNHVAPIKKPDNTPVTLLDYAMQAIIIGKLSKLFPNDKFIAEEDSEFLKADEKFSDEVLEYVKIGTDDPSWTKEQMYEVIDRGAFEGDVCKERVWAIDPIDGTKGFIQGLHFCVSMVLLDHGIPVLSMIGCPNLNIYQVLANKGDAAMIDIGPPVDIYSQQPYYPIENAPADVNHSYPYFPMFNNGSLYYAVSGEGAYARSLTMPLTESFPIKVSETMKLSESTLCEASRTSKHDHLMTRSVNSLVKLKSKYIRLHSQVKYCIIAAGGAEGTIRYPPREYVEKIWDHIPGAHLVQEAGGRVTDLHGFELECTLGKSLSCDVRGIVASNGKIHQKLLYAIETSLQP
jgi:3'(2'), 5'-bisphosphate nucleotidase